MLISKDYSELFSLFWVFTLDLIGIHKFTIILNYHNFFDLIFIMWTTNIAEYYVNQIQS
jgi:hypothetical protein